MVVRYCICARKDDFSVRRWRRRRPVRVDARTQERVYEDSEQTCATQFSATSASVYSAPDGPPPVIQAYRMWW